MLAYFCPYMQDKLCHENAEYYRHADETQPDKHGYLVVKARTGFTGPCSKGGPCGLCMKQVLVTGLLKTLVSLNHW